MSFTRFAIYYLPTDAALAAFGAAWLGWDVSLGQAAKHPDIEGIDAITDTPRKYGFHGTLKPPFRLNARTDEPSLRAALATLARTTPPARCDGLKLSRLGRFLALTPVGEAVELSRVARTCVSKLDDFRAPATEAELARRRRARLSPQQDVMLVRWGYPYVMDEFWFHLTLTGPVPRGTEGHWQGVLHTALPTLPAPFVMDEVALVGERRDGRFEVIERFQLTG